MKILFLTSAHNSLSQRLLVELTERGHIVDVALAVSETAMFDSVDKHAPDLIIAPMLKLKIPSTIWFKYVCLVVHPGVRGDRGPSSLDWAIVTGQTTWGVTVLQAAAEMDAGAIWASHNFGLSGRSIAKSSLYRGHVTDAAVRGVLEAVEKFQSRQFRPEPLDYNRADVIGCWRPMMCQSDRAIDWGRDSTKVIIAKINAADSAPGVLDTLLDKACFLYGAHVEDRLKGPAGEIIAQRDGAICIGTIDGAVWVSHLRDKDQDAPPEGECRVARAGMGRARRDLASCSAPGIKLPAAQVLGSLLRGVPEAPFPIDAPTDHRTFREIVYEEDGDAGYLSFDFYNGAMSTAQCYRLRDAFLYARSRPTKVIALLGGADFWSNGIHLNIIEASDDPAKESWRNINAIDDLIIEILNTMSHLVIAGLRGNAGAGGAMLALAADCVYSAPGVVLNPHYRGMGGLYGSEYWTYLLPKRVGQTRALELTQTCQPIGAWAARNIGFLDEVFGEDARSFEVEIRDRAKLLATNPEFCAILRKKHERRIEDESIKPLANYRAEELERMKVNFFGADPSYHEARRRFVFKGSPPPKAAPLPIPPPTKERVSILFGHTVPVGAIASGPVEIGEPNILMAHGGNRTSGFRNLERIPVMFVSRRSQRGSENSCILRD
jgi:putative two-component system protein, hydrogenase maturation factor HypX/HoxX